MSNQSKQHGKPVLVTGATGYVAGRLIPVLLDAGYRVRAMGRSAEKMACRPWARHPGIELAKGDVMDPASLQEAFRGCSTVYYLVHSMISRKRGYRDADRIGAENTARAAASENIAHIIYLGGLGDISDPHISDHLVSRNEVGRILGEGPVPVTILRAAMILGSGSASFEILRYLAHRLPVMITPKWVDMPTQPIAVTNVVGYLKGCLEHPQVKGKTFDIGGPDVLKYRDLFLMFCKEEGLPRPVIVPVPVLTPALSALWISLLTPVPASIARPLTEGLSLPTTCTENAITEIIPQDLISCREAINRALERIRQEQVDTCWADAGSLAFPEWTHCGDADYAGGTIFECGYRIKVPAPAGKLWPAIEKLGGRTGYYGADILWKLRGLLDILAGGVGLNRGRRTEKKLMVGDALDFWRVLEIDPPWHLLLLAEMKTPGEALLEIRIEPAETDRCELVLLSRFLPAGLAGILYWYLLYPFHQYVFTRMITGMVRSAGIRISSPPSRFTPKIKDSCSIAG